MKKKSRRRLSGSKPLHHGMARLWAPWRIHYVQRVNKNKGCLFCKAGKAKNDFLCHVVHRGRHGLIMLNLFPYNNGHLMVSPLRHLANIDELSLKEVEDLFSLLNLAIRCLRKILHPAGFNIGLNIGRCAGAGFPGHLHIHIVPRWNGDTNFMPLAAGTKVISESLSELYKKLRIEINNEIKTRH